MALITGSWQTGGPPTKEMKALLDSLLPSSGYTLCPGIRDYQSQYGTIIRFQSKNLREWSLPFRRFDSVNCIMWHRPVNQQLCHDQSPRLDCCSNCKTLIRHLTALKKKAESTPLAQKQEWLKPSSNRQLKFLSPTSQKERQHRSSLQRRTLIRRSVVADDDPLDMSLCCDQDRELSKLVLAIQEKGQEDLEKIFEEAEGASGTDNADVMKEVWQRDVLERKEFLADQLRNSEFDTDSS